MIVVFHTTTEKCEWCRGSESSHERGCLVVSCMDCGAPLVTCTCSAGCPGGMCAARCGAQRPGDWKAAVRRLIRAAERDREHRGILQLFGVMCRPLDASEHGLEEFSAMCRAEMARR